VLDSDLGRRIGKEAEIVAKWRVQPGDDAPRVSTNMDRQGAKKSPEKSGRHRDAPSRDLRAGLVRDDVTTKVDKL